MPAPARPCGVHWFRRDQYGTWDYIPADPDYTPTGATMFRTRLHARATDRTASSAAPQRQETDQPGISSGMMFLGTR
ncbi:hypothetical protein GCM10018966_041650 [Streptomyces yanii]